MEWAGREWYKMRSHHWKAGLGHVKHLAMGFILIVMRNHWGGVKQGRYLGFTY